jgi:hypothetical protein
MGYPRLVRVFRVVRVNTLALQTVTTRQEVAATGQATLHAPLDFLQER